MVKLLLALTAHSTVVQAIRGCRALEGAGEMEDSKDAILATEQAPAEDLQLPGTTSH